MQALIGPARETVLLTPIFSKINCIEQKVKKKSYGVITLFYINFPIYDNRFCTITSAVQTRVPEALSVSATDFILVVDLSDERSFWCLFFD